MECTKREEGELLIEACYPNVCQLVCCLEFRTFRVSRTNSALCDWECTFRLLHSDAPKMHFISWFFFNLSDSFKTVLWTWKNALSYVRNAFCCSGNVVWFYICWKIYREIKCNSKMQHGKKLTFVNFKFSAMHVWWSIYKP